MADVLERTSNSVKLRITGDKANEWQKITVGGSVRFHWIVSSSLINIQFSKIIPSDKVNYIVTYTHWENIVRMDTDVMKILSDNFGPVYRAGYLRGETTLTIEISTAQSSSYAIIYDDAELTDFVLRGEDGSVPFHKVVLAAHSSVFKTMLAGEWKETSEGVIDVPGTSKEMLQHLKMYMYLGKLPINQNEQVDCLKQLLFVSSCYLIEDLKLRCMKELRFLVTKENVFDMIQFAMENKLKLLLVDIMDCIAMGDIDVYEVRKLVEAEDATPLQCE